MTNKPDTVSENAPVKKRYESPHLEVYGDIRTVTEAVAHNSNNVDGGNMALKTA